MNCCNDWGQCTQGRDCPVRTGKVLPHQAAHAARKDAHGCAPEGGNVYAAEPDCDYATPWELVAIWAGIVIFALLTVAIIAGAAGFIYQTLI